MRKKFKFLFVYYKIGGVALTQRQQLTVLKILSAAAARLLIT